MTDRVLYDDQAKAAARLVVSKFEEVRREIIIHSQFRRNASVSPTDSNWGKPDPIDIQGIMEQAFVAGIQYANETSGAKK